MSSKAKSNKNETTLERYIVRLIEDGEDGDSIMSPDNSSALNESIDDLMQVPLKELDVQKNAGSFYLDEDGNSIYYEENNTSISMPTKATAKASTHISRRVADKIANKASLLKANIKAEDPELQMLLSDAADKDDMQADEVYEYNEKESTIADESMRIGEDIILLEPNTSMSPPEVHACHLCAYTCSKKYVLSRHLRTHSEARPFPCTICERGFKTNASLQNHLNTHLGNKPHACKSCESAFTTMGELKRHCRYKHTGEKPHKCTECNYSSVELSKLRRHIRCHTGERPYQCPYCTYASPDSFKLKRHLRTHTGEKPYECDICHARFTQSNSLKAHKLIHSVGDKPVFQCSICPTTCGRKTDLRTHMQKQHSSDHPVECKRCGKQLPDRYSYKMHIKTHEGERCFRCTICPYSSGTQRHLESHMLIHTNEKPFICECGQSFRQAQLLKRHHNIYHNEDYIAPQAREKPHICPHCERSFTHKGNLIRHMAIHDPDSNASKIKLELKRGREKRLISGTVVAYVDDSLEEDDDDDDNTLLHLDQSDLTSDLNIYEPGVANEKIDIKLEKTERKYESQDANVLMLPASTKLENEDDYMLVEVIDYQDDDEEDDDEQVENFTIKNTDGSTENKIKVHFQNKPKIKLDNSIGFQNEDQ